MTVLAAMIAVVLITFSSVTPAMMVTNGDMTRDSTAPVVADIDAKLSLEVVNSIRKQGNSYRTLLTVTNNFEQELSVTVYSSDGTLRDDEGDSGSRVTFDLNAHEQTEVEMNPDNSLADGDLIYFDVTAVSIGSNGLRVEAHDRTTTAQTGGGPGNGNGGNNGNGNGNGP